MAENKNQALTKISSSDLNNNVLKSVVSRTEEDVRLVKFVADQRHLQIRNQDQETAEDQLHLQLSLIAKQYVSEKGITDEALAECIDLILEQFSDLSVSEIKQAFRLNAAGKIENVDKHYGQFTAQFLGQLLTQYRKRSKRIKIEIRNQEAIQQAEIERAEQAEQAKKDFDENFDQYLEQQAEMCETWQDVYVQLYDDCMKRNLINFSSRLEMELILALATIIAQEQPNEKDDVRSRIAGRLIFKKVDLETRAKMIARRLTVFWKVLKPLKDEDS